MNHYCREASRLVSDACERELNVFEQVRLNLHLAICAGCRGYEKDVAIMQGVLTELRRHGPESAARLPEKRREQIRAQLQGLSD